MTSLGRLGMADGNEPQPGIMHDVDRAFYELVIQERDYARLQVENRNQQIGELTAEVARLKAEIDSMHATYQTIHVTSLNLQMAMVICRDEEPGTVIRETDGQCRDYVLGEDRTWTAR